MDTSTYHTWPEIGTRADGGELMVIRRLVCKGQSVGLGDDGFMVYLSRGKWHPINFYAPQWAQSLADRMRSVYAKHQNSLGQGLA